MPIKVQVEEDKYTVFRAVGEIRDEDFLQANAWHYKKVEARIARYQIVDMLNVESMSLSLDGLERMARQDRQAAASLGTMAIACVATEEMELGYSRLWEQFAKTPGIKIEVFRKFEDAKDWLFNNMENYIL